MLREYASSVFFSLFPVVQNHMVLFLKSIHYNRSQIANARTLHKGNGRAFAVISTVTLQHGLIAEKQYRRKQEHGLLI